MITLDETIELLQRAVTEKGDGHTASPQLRHLFSGEPICIVGHVLDYVGIDLGYINVPVYRLPMTVQERFTPAALHALNVAQAVQDNRGAPRPLQEPKGTWGEALIAAKEVKPSAEEVKP
jgi:hypothetical protein